MVRGHGQSRKGTFCVASWQGIEVAVKKLGKEVTVDEDKMRAFRDELELLKKIRHPNVVQFLGAVTKYPNDDYGKIFTQELGTKEKYKGKMRMDYSEMNEEERNEKLTSVISYCKGDAKANETPIEEPKTGAKVLDIPSPHSLDIDSQTNNQLPQVINVNEPAHEQMEPSTTGHWEEKELVSKDGQAKLKANVFFASFDQRSDKAAGESACTTLAAVIANWLQSNQDNTPTRAQFDRLIVEGSSKWRKLCDNQDLINQFPDKHFNIQTVLQTRLRPISVLHKKSFIGFFGPEKFETLKGAMFFDQIWDEIKKNAEVDNDMPRIYIVSWNDHFFVLKVDVNLFEGCNQAYILRFDDSALIHGNVEKEGVSFDQASEDEIFTSKECCREFMKRFLAAIPLRELESKEKKEPVSCFALH
ncbi:Integrin-linked protein kinase 1 [Camellia lanceoleosa]|uniref:Integrin-linked protein kinase 1 n=1 Tax=Camellia lanceoleosa TaxID=1840588 RepID=A0ACC0I2R7_9ERIC|nr:Integrin-linked protein kinase 1 [Camellia lanceoleosa]